MVKTTRDENFIYIVPASKAISICLTIYQLLSSSFENKSMGEGSIFIL